MIFGTVLITGTSRGLGLEMVRQLVPVSRLIVATCRTPDTAKDLLAVSEGKSNVLVKKLDVTDFSSFPDFVHDLQNSNDSIKNEGLGCLINNAGCAPKSTRYNMVTAEQMLKTLTVNTVAPLMLTKACIPLLRASKSGSLVANLSSILGSIDQNHPSFGSGSGGLYPYRSSKSALNMITRSLSIDLTPLGISALAIHPGWVKTDMGGKNAPLNPHESVHGVLKVLAEFDPEIHNGCFIDYKGETLPW